MRTNFNNDQSLRFTFSNEKDGVKQKRKFSEKDMVGLVVYSKGCVALGGSWKRQCWSWEAHLRGRSRALCPLKITAVVCWVFPVLFGQRSLATKVTGSQSSLLLNMRRICTINELESYSAEKDVNRWAQASCKADLKRRGWPLGIKSHCRPNYCPP